MGSAAAPVASTRIRPVGGGGVAPDFVREIAMSGSSRSSTHRAGTAGRVPASYDADLHLGYPLQMRFVSLTFLADIFNILNTQRVLAVDQGYNTSEFTDPGYVCGSVPGSADQQKCSSNFGRPIARSLPTSVRFALKLGF